MGKKEVRLEYQRFLEETRQRNTTHDDEHDGTTDTTSQNLSIQDDDSDSSDSSASSVSGGDDDDLNDEENSCSETDEEYSRVPQRAQMVAKLQQLHQQLAQIRQETEEDKSYRLARHRPFSERGLFPFSEPHLQKEQHPNSPISVGTNESDPGRFSLEDPIGISERGNISEGKSHSPIHESASSVDMQQLSKQYVPDKNKIIVCCVRRPIKLSRDDNGEGWNYEESRDGFSSSMQEVKKYNNVKFVSWPGTEVDEASQGSVRNKLIQDYDCVPVFLEHELSIKFYHTYCGDILWPVLHQMKYELELRNPSALQELHEAYALVNRMFLDEVSRLYEPGDMVLVFDFHLMLLPSLLRRRIPDVRCGFVLHSPFPSSESWRTLPARDSLLHGVLGADLIGFHHYDYVRHFLHTCTRLLGLESSPRMIEYDGRVITLAIQPLGIDANDWKKTPAIEKYVVQLRRSFAGKKVIVAVDRLDFVKGIPLKLLAFDTFLENYPEWRGRVVLCQIVRYSGRIIHCNSDRILSKQVNELVGRINGRFGNAMYCPIHYLKASIPFEELVALLNMADVGLVTSVREGVNTMALEYVASQDSTNPGTLIHSEFAGCVGIMQGALIVNPHNSVQVAEKIKKSLEMGVKKRRIKHAQMLHYISSHSSAIWAGSVFSMLRQPGVQDFQTQKLNTNELINSFKVVHGRRLLLLDFRGTLVTHQTIPQLAKPSKELVELIGALAEDERNDIFILSGTKMEYMEEWFGHLPIGLAAEHGYYYRFPPTSNWKDIHSEKSSNAESQLSRNSTPVHHPEQNELPVRNHTAENASQDSKRAINHYISNESILSSDAETTSHLGKWATLKGDMNLWWKDEVESLLEYFSDRTPGSFLVTGDSCVTWHYRDADPEHGLAQAKDLQLQLEQSFSQQPVQVVIESKMKYLLVLPGQVKKGAVVKHWMKHLQAMKAEEVSHVDDASTEVKTEAERNAENGSSQHDERDEERMLQQNSLYDLTICIGNDRTDESMFKQLNRMQVNAAWLISVGQRVSSAHHHVEDVDEVVDLLYQLKKAGEHQF